MKTKLFTGLALATLLLIGGPAFAQAEARGEGRAVSGGAVAAYHGGAIASGRTFRSTASVAFGGTAYNSNAYGASRAGIAGYGAGLRQGSTVGREYFANGRHYRWYGNGWVIVNSYPGYDYGYGYDYGTSYPYGNSVSVQVQQALAQQGYYQGPINGVLGAGTQAAIAAYQRDNGLQVTGGITTGLLNSLGLD
jgi:hypothetical protein